MKMQQKFQTAHEGIAERRGLELVVEHTYANTGWYSLQLRNGFEPVLRFQFNFRPGWSSFGSRRRPGPLGRSPKGGPWTQVQGGGHDQVIARVESVLAARAESVLIVVLGDGETYGPLVGTGVYEVPSRFDGEAIEEALEAGSLEGRALG